MSSDPPSQAGDKFQRLVSIMALLRGENGCPWDREQTFDTIKPYLLEETYEVMQAVDARDWRELTGELGDLMLQAVFFAQMASEQGYFNIEDSLDAINAKLIRRHPHVFGDAEAQDANDVKIRWDQIKAEENRSANSEPKLLLESVPRALPALVEAQQISSRAARAGFDWKGVEQVLEKLEEELNELRQARSRASQMEIEGEIGDILFVIVNIARFLNVDPEQALRKSNGKFRARFAYVEQSLIDRGQTIAASNMEQMEELWQEAKRSE